MNAVDVVKQALLGAGTAWILWLLAALSAMSLAIAMERLVFLRRRGGDLRALAEGLDRDLSGGDVHVAIEHLQGGPGGGSVAGAVAAAGLRLAHLGPVSAERAMASAVALERVRLERGLAFLGTVGNNAPFIGLLGTVIGIVEAFDHLGHGHAHGTASQAVMSSIAEALVTTAVGIGVALPAVVAYNVLQRQVAQLLGGTEALSQLVLAYLSRTPPEPAQPPTKGG